MVDDRGDIIEVLANHVEDRPVLRMDEFEDLPGRRQVDLAGARVPGFGAQATQELEEGAIVQGSSPGSTALCDGQRMMTNRPMSLWAEPVGPSTLIR